MPTSNKNNHHGITEDTRRLLRKTYFICDYCGRREKTTRLVEHLENCAVYENEGARRWPTWKYILVWSFVWVILFWILNDFKLATAVFVQLFIIVRILLRVFSN